jgi:ribonucrease Y
MLSILICSVILNIFLLCKPLFKPKKVDNLALPTNVVTSEDINKAVKARTDQFRADFEQQSSKQSELIQQSLQRKQLELESWNTQLLNSKSLYDEKTKLLAQKLESLVATNDQAKIKSQLTEYKQLAQAKTDQELLQYEQKMRSSIEERVSLQGVEMVALAVQRASSEVANEHTITTVEVADEEVKGKIIGKNGRNIQWLEKTLGVEIIVDETPNQVTISGFNSIRREVAKQTLKLLLDDGRIHPASIEEMYARAKKNTQEIIMERGRNALGELEITGYPNALVELIGRLHFRTSYGQNMLRHSVEMAGLAKLLATQINQEFSNLLSPIDVSICMQGALLHDIGKAMDEETIPKGDHVDLGRKICDRFELDWRVKCCISSHHNEQYFDPQYGFCIEAPIVDACDNISGARLGARKSTKEEYTQRLHALEQITNGIEGVTKSWIMRGNKELWVFFDTEKIDHSKMQQLLHTITQKIEDELTTPAAIKVVGYWEDRIVEYAK